MPCAKPCRSCDYHIGGKYFPPTPFSKQTTVIPSASSYTVDVKYTRGFLQSSGWQNPWPPTKSTFTCMNDQKQILPDIARRSAEQYVNKCFSVVKLVQVTQTKQIDTGGGNDTESNENGSLKNKYLIY